MELYHVDTPFVARDLQIMQYGREACRPSYGFGPSIRNDFLMHYILRGKGKLEVGNSVYNLSEGEMFVIFPSQAAYYEADATDPWEYCWVEFLGDYGEVFMERASIFRHSPVVKLDDATADLFKKLIEGKNMRFEECMSAFWALAHALTRSAAEAPARSLQEEYIHAAEEYIRANLQSALTVGALSERIGINRSYLCRLFTKYKHQSPQQFILETKLNASLLFLKNSDASIHDIAQMVGYSDQFAFSRKFKQYFNVSPTRWRRENFAWQSVRKISTEKER